MNKELTDVVSFKALHGLQINNDCMIYSVLRNTF